MSKARHEKHDTEKEPKSYNDSEPDVSKEAEGEEPDEKMHRGGRKKKAGGGKMEHEKEIEGHHGKKRFDRPGRKRGGAVGADSHPLTTAAHVKSADDHKATDGNAEGD